MAEQSDPGEVELSMSRSVSQRSYARAVEAGQERGMFGSLFVLLEHGS